MAEKLKLSAEEKELRKEFQLPVTKPLRFMRRTKTFAFSAIPVESFEVCGEFESGNKLLKLVLTTNETVCVHSMFFAHMQKKSFEADMAKGYIEEE